MASVVVLNRSNPVPGGADAGDWTGLPTRSVPGRGHGRGAGIVADSGIELMQRFDIDATMSGGFGSAAHGSRLA